MKREHLKSRLGFILISAGCAIGIGNVWKFPWMVGQNGGGIFVLIYLFFLIIMGVPAMTMEFALGRASQKSPTKLYQELEKEGQKWHWHGIICLIGNFLLMMFYTTVAGWMINYFIKTAKGDFVGADGAKVNEIFNTMQSSPAEMVGFMAIAVFIGVLVCSFGVQKGLEKVSKVMMVALLVIMVILAGNSIFMEGGGEGLKFYLLPDVDRFLEAGVGNVIVSAMNQAFFTLSIGIGSMAIFGSYIGKERSLMGESVNIAFLDTFVAFSSGLIIFPACFAHNVDVTAGPPLIFITLPQIFNTIPLGRLWGSLFFVFMSFAAMSTVFAVFENIVSCTMDLFEKWSRKKACLICGILLFVLSIPCALGYNLLSDFKPFGEGSAVLDLEDFIVSNIILPLGCLVIVLFCTRKIGWGWDNFVSEANQGKGLKVKKWMKFYMSYILPAIVFVLFIVGVVSKFA